MHALIIDDDKSNLGVLAQILELSGFDYTALQDPTEIDAVLASNIPYDVVLLDLEMPDLNGYEIYEILRQQPHLTNIPIIACTVHTSEINTVRDMGFNSLISKPIDVDKFAQQLEKILSGGAIWQTS